MNHFLIDRRKKRREKIIAAAIDQGGTLTPEAQDTLVKQHLADGWGRLAHGVTRQLKAPTRYGLKLVDVAIVLTIYDRTIAQVVPKMFAPITVDEFEIETGMDGSNLRAALRELIKKSILVKTSYKTLNFWGLNHAYFDRQKEVPSPRVTETQGPSPQGNAPCDKQGNSPCVKVGQTNPPPAASNSCNHSSISAAKNLLQESKKESLSSSTDSGDTTEFPEDMQSRWKNLNSAGKQANTTKEREIFKELFVTYGSEFFLNCGKVIHFLEDQGNGKAGEAGKVYNPMAYLRGHWEHNLDRYKTWLQKQADLDAAKAKQVEIETQEREQKAAIEKNRAIELQSQAEQEAQMQFHIQKLFKVYQNEAELNAFIQNTVQLSQCDFTLNSWRKQGWKSPVVQSCVVSHFLDLQKTQCQHPTQL